MRAAEPTPFAAEGPCRAGIRESLCLDGWRWSRADDEAADIVAAALAEVGARRPTWQQGQPEYTQPGALPILREDCARCRKPLPPGHYKFCCTPCSVAYHEARRHREWGEMDSLNRAARRAAWSAKQPHQDCPHCGMRFQPNRPKQRFCSFTCGRAYFAGVDHAARRF